MGERPSGFTEAEHHRLLRTNPLYGLNLRMDELAMQQEPSLNQDILEETIHPKNGAYVQENEQVTKIYTRINIDNKALELQKRIVSLEEKIKKMRGGAKGRGGEEYVIK